MGNLRKFIFLCLRCFCLVEEKKGKLLYELNGNGRSKVEQVVNVRANMPSDPQLIRKIKFILLFLQLWIIVALKVDKRNNVAYFY